MNRLSAILLLRCPHCREGRVFHRLWHMNTDCPVCSVHFEREPGYWMMSVFVGYVIYGVVLAPLSLLLYFQERPLMILLLIISVAAVLLAVPVFIYARVIWLHVDEVLDPRRDNEVTSQDSPSAAAGSRDSSK